MNELSAQPADTTGASYRKVVGWQRMREAYTQYLQDESRMRARSIRVLHLPATREEVAVALLDARSRGHRVAVSGARTGITGAAVPIEVEEVISLELFKREPVVRRAPGGGWVADVAAGTTVDELADALVHGLCDYPDGRPPASLFYPVDTTETSAHIGGTIATNASGARTLFYGPTRDQVEALTVVMADAGIVTLRRGEVQAEGGKLRYRGPDGTLVEMNVPDLPIPRTKHTAGYHLRSDMDALDLFVGSEGTLGIVVQAELRLSPTPQNRLFLTQFLPASDNAEATAVDLVHACKHQQSLTSLALEYIGPRALALLRSQGPQTPAYMEVSRLPEDAGAALYMEVPFADEEELDTIYLALREVLGLHRLPPQQSWAGFTVRDMNEMKRLRHAVPESVNSIIGRRQRDVPELHKVGTDMAVPDQSLKEMMNVYRSRLAGSGLDYVIFGHIGSGHVHVNILPETLEDVVQAEDLYAQFAREAVRLGGSVAAEHGIGRIKRKFLPIQYTSAQIEAMRAVKYALDPEGTLNPGVLFD